MRHVRAAERRCTVAIWVKHPRVTCETRPHRARRILDKRKADRKRSRQRRRISISKPTFRLEGGRGGGETPPRSKHIGNFASRRRLFSDFKLRRGTNWRSGIEIAPARCYVNQLDRTETTKSGGGTKTKPTTTTKPTTRLPIPKDSRKKSLSTTLQMWK